MLGDGLVMTQEYRFICSSGEWAGALQALHGYPGVPIRAALGPGTVRKDTRHDTCSTVTPTADHFGFKPQMGQCHTIAAILRRGWTSEVAPDLKQRTQVVAKSDLKGRASGLENLDLVFFFPNAEPGRHTQGQTQA